jgi:hypothetical protein
MRKFNLTVVLFFTFLFGFSQTMKRTVTATFQGFESGVYYFEDTEEEFYEFTEINPKILEKYKLKEEDLVDNMFEISYEITLIIDEYDEEIETYKLTGLKKTE